jgi:hypothetical protein
MSRETCPRCAVGYDPRLTGRRCPVCDAPAPGAGEAAPVAGRDRLMTIVLIAAVLNVTLLVGLAVAVARAS